LAGHRFLNLAALTRPALPALAAAADAPWGALPKNANNFLFFALILPFFRKYF